MTLIARDLMVGNPKLKKLGFGEEALGHNAILSGFQGQRQWTDHMPNGDFLEAILCSSFDWNGIRPPYLVATENDAMNGVPMLFGYSSYKYSTDVFRYPNILEPRCDKKSYKDKNPLAWHRTASFTYQLRSFCTGFFRQTDQKR